MYKGDYRGAFSPFGIAIRMITRDKKGTIGILFIAIVSVIVMNFGIVSLDVALNMKENNDYWLAIDKSDIMITASAGETVENIEKKLSEDDNILKTAKCCMNGVLIVEREKNGEVERIEELVGGSGNVIPRTEQFSSIMEMIVSHFNLTSTWHSCLPLS